MSFRAIRKLEEYARDELNLRISTDHDLKGIYTLRINTRYLMWEKDWELWEEMRKQKVQGATK